MRASPGHVAHEPEEDRAGVKRVERAQGQDCEHREPDDHVDHEPGIIQTWYQSVDAREVSVFMCLNGGDVRVSVGS
jgi:hypothetical protein